MKKHLICLASLLLIIATGCNKNKQEVESPADPATVELSEDNIRIVQFTWNQKTKEELPTVYTLTISPEDGQYAVSASPEGIVDIKQTDNTLQLTARNIGTTQLTITDTVTLQTAVCRVEVFSVVETLTFPYATVVYTVREWDMDSYTLIDSAFFYTDENGKSIPMRAYIVDATLSLFSEGFYLKDELFQGADIGYIVSFPATAYYAPVGLNEDRGVTSAITYEAGVWSTAQTTSYHKLQAGRLDKEREQDAIEHISTAIAATNANTDEAWETYYSEMHIADSLAFHGALIRKYIRVGDGYSTSPMPFALVNAGAVDLIAGAQTPSKDMFKVNEAIMYINPLLGYYGLGVDLAYDAQKGIWYNASSQFLIGKSYHYQYPNLND